MGGCGDGTHRPGARAACGRLLLLAALVLLPWLCRPSAASAQTPSIQVVADRAEVHLPGEVVFHLQATASARITTVKIEFGTDALTCGGALSTWATPEFAAGQTVSADYTWELLRRGTLPPGARIWWRWHVADERGETLVTDRQELRVEDSRFSWRHVERPPLALYWYDGSEAFAQALVESGAEGLARLTADTGVVITGTVQVYVYATPQDLIDVVLYAPSWAGGVAFPEHQVVLIGIAPGSLEWGRAAIRHELAHVVVGRLTFNCLADLPTWLSEGLAVYAEGALDPGSQAALDRAIREDTLDSVRSLSAPFSAHPARATLAYAESFSLVDFLVAGYGQRGMLTLLEAFRAGTSADRALRAVYGFDSDGLEDAWRAAVGARPRAATNATPTPLHTPIPTLPPIGSEPLAASATPGSTQPATPTAEPAHPSDTPRPAATSTPAPTPGAAGGGLLCLPGAAAAIAGVWLAVRGGRAVRRPDESIREVLP